MGDGGEYDGQSDEGESRLYGRTGSMGSDFWCLMGSKPVMRTSGVVLAECFGVLAGCGSGAVGVLGGEGGSEAGCMGAGAV